MKANDLLGMMGGLALFLYGMTMMSEGLENMAGNRLEKILKQLTHHKIKAVCVGVIITALIQSSSAMTVMLVGFVNSGIMPLENAIWVVMGANIGTTMTGQMIALDIGVFAPVFAFIGIILFVFCSRLKYLGSAIGGIGILFMGLEIMSLSLMPLKNSYFFLRCIQWFSYPLFGMIIGALFTAMIQSSSASIGILQSLSKQGFFTLQQSAYMIYGFDIGTCITAFLASFTGNRSGKQLALFHLILNLFGTIIFTILSLLTPFLHWISLMTPHSLMRQLANLHTIFNIGTTIIALCFDRYFIKMIYKILPNKQ